MVAHLNKSHVTVHTYPESHPDNGISTFRVDVDVSTCGVRRVRAGVANWLLMGRQYGYGWASAG